MNTHKKWLDDRELHEKIQNNGFFMKAEGLCYGC